MNLLFIDQNVTDKVTSSQFLSGVNNIDPGNVIEQGFLLPYVFDPTASWMDWRCGFEIELDPGVVVHKILPQSQQAIDTLASQGFVVENIPTVQAGTPTSPPLKQAGFGNGQPFAATVAQANTVSAGDFADIAQRMSTSIYTFLMRGWAIRAGYKIPVPGLKYVCGVPAVPIKPQWVNDSEIVANYSGVPIYFAQWKLAYTVTVPPKKAQTPPPNIAEHITATQTLPSGMQAPYSQPDSLALQSGYQPPQPLPRVIRPGG